MEIKEYVKQFNKGFITVKSEFKEDFDSLFEKEKEWIGNLEKKTNKIKDISIKEVIDNVIEKLKNNSYTFSELDSSSLTLFLSQINSIVLIANRINNFKEGTILNDGSKLQVHELLNKIKGTKKYSDLNIDLNQNLNAFLPHLFSVVKHCQNPAEYPIYYKYWKNILREVLGKADDYDSLCDFYRTFPETDRHLNFGVYLGTIGIAIAKNIDSIGVRITKDSKTYKYLTKELLNLERYNEILDEKLGFSQEESEKLKSTKQPKDTPTELDKNKLSEYWLKYKEYFKKPAKEHKEKYKWSVLKQVYEKWNWNVEDKAEMFKNAFEVEGSKNLWLSGNFYPIEHTNWMFAQYPKETIKIFNTLFNEAILLTERINTFIDFYNFKLPELQKLVPEKKLNYHSHNDLRAIALYLSLEYPEKYYLYKHSMVKAFCEKLEIPSIRSGEKENLGKFVGIANVVQDFIEKDTDFIKEYRSFTTEEGHYNDDSLHLLTQDFIYTIASHFATNDGLRFKEIIEELKELVLLEDSPIKDYNFEETASDYVWILDNDKINDVNVHYEIYRIPKTKSLTINIHFESKNKSENDFFERNIQLPDDSEWFKWEKSKSIRQKERYDLDSENIVDELFDGLIQFEASVGELVRKAISNKSLIVNTNPENKTKMKFPLNQILYGAPGTGKTFKTKELAVEIITGNKIKNREELTKEYDRLKKNNQINFTTFHQSISYEDFVEGIKPVLKSEDEDEDKITKDSQIEYEIKDGIFKKLCQLSEGVTSKVEVVENFDFQNKDFFKMSLGGKHRLEKHNWSIKNNLIFLGWGGDKDFSRLNKIKDWKLFRDAFKKDFPDLVSETKYVIQAVYIFQKMKIGDIVIISKGNKIIDAIGIIESEYFFDDTKDIDHYQFRKVKWLATDMNVSPDIFVSKGISQQTIYQFYNDDINIEAFNENFKKQTLKEEPKKHVLIIDEINRGNISAIFGELITLIEEDKRKGILKPNIEVLEVELPYSRDKFSVPDNLYIIGTMNTADRSVESLDTALRRRFSFVEMQPNLDVLKNEHITNGVISLGSHIVDMVKMLDKINKRIEILIDKDHKIGHSFFINVFNFEELQSVFKDKIIPLLEEYFFGDFGKIGLVLGESFIMNTNTAKKDIFAKFDDYEDRSLLIDKLVYDIKNPMNIGAEHFIAIYE